MRKFILIIVLIFCVSAIFAQTKVQKSGKEWILTVDEKPFEIRGVTFGFDKSMFK